MRGHRRGHVFEAQAEGSKASPHQVQELHDARSAFDDLRPHGSRDAEAVYKRNPEFANDVASGIPDAVPLRPGAPLQMETELRQDPDLRAARFVERWQKLDRASEHRYAAGDYSGYKAARAEMGNMAIRSGARSARWNPSLPTASGNSASA